MVVVLDTNHFSEFGRATVFGARLRDRAAVLDAELFTTVVTAQEAVEGWLAVIRRAKPGSAQVSGYRQFQSTLSALHEVAILPFDDDAAQIFEALLRRRIRIGTMDLKIAAICIVHDCTLLTRNLVDFEKVPGLGVENWLD